MKNEYEDSIIAIIEDIKNENNKPKNIDYFINLIKNRHLNYKTKFNDIALFGIMIPEEIIRALGLNPIWCLSGSYELSVKYSDKFPRDVDPVVKASYGMYKQYETPLIISYQNDSMRKLSWLLKEENKQVFDLDIPSCKDMVKSKNLYTKSVKLLITRLEKRYKTVLKPYNLYKNHKDIQSARQAIFELIEKNKITSFISSYMLHFIISAYYCTQDIEEYTNNVKIVLDELNKNKSVEKKICIGVIGSPIFFPNNKILKLTRDLGVNINFAYNENNMFSKEYNLPDSNNSKDIVKAITDYYFKENYMPYNICKKHLIGSSLNDFDGVIYLVLKGELSYDYDFLKLEDSLNVPIIRLETDYNKEDLEQLKIRIEAFLEMINGLKVSQKTENGQN